MARLKKTRTKNPSLASATSIVPAQNSQVPSGSGGIIGGVKTLANFAIEGVGDHLKSVVGTALVGTTIAIGLYFWRGQAIWLYPLIPYVAFFLAGVLIVFIPITIVAIRRRRQSSRAENEARTRKFISEEKGLLDHSADFENAQKRFPKILAKIRKEMGNIAAASSNPRFTFWARFNSSWAQKSASKLAAKFLKYASNMEAQRVELVKTFSMMNESLSYNLRHGGIQKGKLPEVYKALNDLIVKSRETRLSLGTFRDAQHEVKGVSKDMATAMNYLASVTGGIIQALENAEKDWQKHIYLIESRL